MKRSCDTCHWFDRDGEFGELAETGTDPYLIRLAKSWMEQGLFSADEGGECDGV